MDAAGSAPIAGRLCQRFAARALAAQDPSNSEWQRDLIVSHWKLAEVAEQRDGGGGALRHYRRAARDRAGAAGCRPAGAGRWIVGELAARIARLGGSGGS
jgi:hypothetical protein